jgi:hypothetical protein
MKLRTLVLFVGLLALVRPADANDVADRRSFAQSLSKQIIRSGIKKVYLADFTDGSGSQFILGRFFAATFSGISA